MTTIETITETLRANLDFLVGSRDEDMIAATAAEWEGMDIDAWLEADVFQAITARKLEAAGVTPAEVAALEGSQIGDPECTRVGYAVANGDVSVAKVVRAVRKARDA